MGQYKYTCANKESCQKHPFSKQLGQLFVARTPLIFAGVLRMATCSRRALLTAVNDESIKTGEERRIILKKGKFSPLEAYDYQLERWTREHEHFKQKVQGNSTVAEIELASKQCEISILFVTR